MQPRHSLAIVVPVYKSAFLKQSLASIASQTDKRFHLYIGNDASPEPIAEILSEFSGKLPMNYARFGKNLGGSSLVKHWERCIRMSGEPWIWLFSDDDIMEPNCVEKFYRELEKTKNSHDLYRFNTISINSNGKKIHESPPHPQNETGADFLFARLRGGRKSTMQELIFSRDAWNRGGIPEFPLAWASDDAFITLLGLKKPIRTISGARVHWRLSDENISEKRSAAVADEKIQASRKFLDWAIRFLETHPPAAGKLSKTETDKLAEDWFFLQLIFMRRKLSLRRCLEIDALASTLWSRWKGYGFLKSLKFNWNLACAKTFGQ